MFKSSIRFEDILDDCVTAIQEQGKTVAQCLAEHADQREELEPLLRLVVHLQAARALQAPPEFRRVSARHVRQVIADRQRRIGRAVRRPYTLRPIYRKMQAAFATRRRLAVATVVCAVLAVWLLVGGRVAYASADALPGDVLYPVKRVVENVQLAVSVNDTRLYLSFVGRRLDELALLVEKDRLQDAGQALANYGAQAERMLSSLREASSLSAEARATLADQLAEARVRHEERFTILLEQGPKDARPVVEMALAASQATHDQALKLLGAEPIPTMTLSPTAVPAQASTEVPVLTFVPTRSPTEAATSTPVPMQPSDEVPTSTPAPTLLPIQVPTSTLVPTLLPIGVPTSTLVPTLLPIGVPTSIPVPTQLPIGVPTSIPVPTQLPIKVPTSIPIPTLLPTEVPTSIPVPTQPPAPSPLPEGPGLPTLPAWWPTPPAWWPTPPSSWPTPPSWWPSHHEP